jgi:tryptophanyl-tRNA synthetase
VARRFNHVFGREPGFEEAAQAAIKKMGKKNARLYGDLRKRYQEQGDHEAVAVAQALLEEQQNLTHGDRERLLGYLEGGGRMILTEPEALLTPASKMPGLDGQKMSKSYHNTIALREDPEVVRQKLRTMPTDPARIRRTDAGNPDLCPVWQLHLVYSDDATRSWARNGCLTAGIGCLECKQTIIESVLNELAPLQERAREYEQDKERVRAIIAEGSEAARAVARETLEEIRAAMGLDYSLKNLMRNRDISPNLG